jgi:hypothetical protein
MTNTIGYPLIGNFCCAWLFDNTRHTRRERDGESEGAPVLKMLFDRLAETNAPTRAQLVGMLILLLGLIIWLVFGW